MVGDFNMVEHHSNIKSSTYGRMMSAPERLLFNGLKEALQIQEFPLTQPSLVYSWDNGKLDNDKVMAT